MGKNLNSEHWGLGIGDYCVLLLPLEDILQKQVKMLKNLTQFRVKIIIEKEKTLVMRRELQ